MNNVEILKYITGIIGLSGLIASIIYWVKRVKNHESKINEHDEKLENHSKKITILETNETNQEKTFIRLEKTLETLNLTLQDNQKQTSAILLKLIDKVG